MKQTITYTLGDIDEFATYLLPNITHRLVCLKGEMGVGKTTLIKALSKKLGAIDLVNSPTYSLVNQYLNTQEENNIFHLDLYRLESLEDALDIGIEEYLSTNSWIFIEWPEKVEMLLPNKRTTLFLENIDMHTRKLRLQNE